MALSRFFGRDAERERLLQLIRVAPLVTVTGPGGVGKTRLVAEATGVLPQDLSRAVLTCELTSLPTGATVDAVSAEAGWPTPEAAAVSLAQSPGVLVLDNCEHVLDAAAVFVARLLRVDETLRVVATSREPLGVQGEHVLVLPSLAVPESDVDVESSPAVQLFLDRAGSAGGNWDRSPSTLSAIGALCRQLDGLPLAIELAAARARALSPDDLLGLMTHRLDLLERSGRHADATERHRSLRAAIDVSADLLDDEERSFLQRLGAFAGPFDVDLAHAVAASPGADRLHVVDVLGRLVDRSLVVAEHDGSGTRYRLLEVLREYAVEGLVRSGKDEEAAEQFVDVMVVQADRMVTEGFQQWTGELLARIAARFHDLIAAITWCHDHDEDPDRAYRLIVPLLEASHTRSVEVLAIGRRVLGHWGERPAPGRALANAVMATAAVMAGGRSEAVDYGQHALRDAGPTDVVGMVAHRALGLAARAADDRVTARGHFAAGREAAAALGADSFERELAAYEASMLDQLGEHEQAVELIDGVIARSVAASDLVSEAWARHVSSTLAMEVDDWDVARSENLLAREVIRRQRYGAWPAPRLRLEAMLVANAAALRSLQQGWAAASEDWHRAIDAAAAHGSTGELALTLRAAAAVAARLGHETVALALLEAAPTSTQLADLPEAFPTVLRRLEQAQHRVAPPDIATALRRARAALALDPEVGAPAADDSEAAHAAPAVSGALRRDGDVWTIEYAGSRVVVRHLKGLADLAVLLSSPGDEIHCLHLMGGADVGGSVGPALDDRARQAYRSRILELEDDIAAARDDGNAEAAARAEVELDTLVTQLSEAFGLSGRPRSRGSSTERARTAVTYRIRAAIRRVTEFDPDLGRHLDNAVRTGTWCSYRPETDVVWDLAP